MDNAQNIQFCQQHLKPMPCTQCQDYEQKFQKFVLDKKQFLQNKQNLVKEEFNQKQKRIREFAERFQIFYGKILKEFEDDKQKFERETQQLIETFQSPQQQINHLSDFQLYQQTYNYGDNDSSMKIFQKHQKKIQENIEKFEKFLDKFKNPPQQILPVINISGKLNIEKQQFYIPVENDPQFYTFTVNKDGTFMAFFDFDLQNIQIRKYEDQQYKKFKELDVGLSLNYMKFGPDNTLYVGEDGEIVVWKFENDEWENKVGYNAHAGKIINEIIIDTKETIYTCGDDKSVEVRQKHNDIWKNNNDLKIQLDFVPLSIKINTSENLLAVRGVSEVQVFQKTQQQKWELIKIFKEKGVLNFEFLKDSLACLQIQDQIRFYTIQGTTFIDNVSIHIQIKNIDLKTPFIWSQGFFIMNQTDNKFSVAVLVNDSLQVKAQQDGQLKNVQISQNKKTMISLNYEARQFRFYKIQ